ncbi:MAG: tandem-95 repeat protein, partial [Bacteroidetes bacterium]|nr:tandem-95 repeat protein [Bacteroidota bacterium]
DEDASCTYPAQTYLNCDGSCINDTDSDGVCNELEVPGCTDPTACNYNAAATDEDASCTYPAQTYLNCDGSCINDTDNDGVCNELEVPGCTDPTACNYNAAATDDNASCTYPAQTYLNCDGSCINDADNDGVCNELEVPGCTDPTACNYNAAATDDNASCTYPAQSYLNCDGTCINDTDNDGICNELEVPGCTDPTACNYNAAATDEDASCTYPAQTYLNCDGSCINDTDSDGVCNELEVPGCTDPTACNFDENATDDNATCSYPNETYLNCDSSCINDADEDGVCDEVEVPGCTDPEACNFDELATDDNASCTYPTLAYLNCDGLCINDADNDGICDEEETGGCTDSAACNYDPSATDDDGSCAYASLTYYVDGDGDGFGSGDGALYCNNPGEGFSENSEDCDDTNADISPAATELCNLIDDDCDFEVDEFVTITYYADADGDGYGNASETIEACELPEGYTNNQDDCDDAILTFQDLDGDGMGSAVSDACGVVSNDDCNDNNAQIFLGAEEICGNEIDEDCDGQDLICPIEGCTDPVACNYNELAEVDNATCTYPASSSVGCNGLCLADSDGDGICDPDEIPGCMHEEACNYNPNATDEDDTCVYPAPLLNCDGSCINDSDLDGVCDEQEVEGCQDETACNYNAEATDAATCTYASLVFYIDADADGVGAGDGILFCEAPTEGYSDHPGDCNDNDATIYGGAPEVCNGIDDDCDTDVDEGVLITFYLDTDGDGFGDNNNSILACQAPQGYVDNDADCDDTQVTYTDADGDGYGSEGWVACGSYFNNDCDDANENINPIQTEICGNGIDEDCSGADAICPVIVASDNNFVFNEDDSNVVMDILTNDEATSTEILPSTLDLDVTTPGVQSTVTTSAGTWVANASGQIIFTPNANYNSAINGDAILTYQVSDANGVTSNVATIVVELTPVEDNPIIVEEAIDSITPFQTPIVICLNAQEVDGQDNFIINVAGPENGMVVGLDDADYCFTYIPDSTFSGLDSIAIVMCDSGEGSVCDTVWITIEVGLGAPIAHNDEATINEDELIVLNVLDNDDAGDLVIDPASVDLDPTTPGVQQTYSNADGDWSIDGIGNLTFTPALNFNGNAHLLYSVNDTTGATSNTAMVIIHVLPVNDAPQVLDENQTVVEETNFETPVVICINVQDVEGDLVSMTVLTGAANGNLSQVNDGDLCFEYTPNNDFVGLDSIAFVICDNGVPTLCDTAYVYINVVPTAPVVIDDNGSVNEDESVSLAILENDVTNGAVLDLNTIDLDPTTPVVQNITTTSEGTWSVDGSGILTFVPAANFNGIASINYTVSDVNGNLSNTGVVNIVVNPINDAPNGPATVMVSTPFETAIVVCVDAVLVVDIDGDDVTITSVVTDPANGVASDVNDGDLCFTYTPNANFTGLDSILVTICDNGSPSLCDSVWVYVNVQGTSPIAADDYVNSNTATVSIDVALNDIIPGNVDYTVSIVDSTSNGNVAMNGSLISYTPNFGFCGTDSLTYAICNAMGMCDTAMLIIDVTPTDADSDGISDYHETLEGDADGDGTPNYLDTDSDNDGVSDTEEAGTTSLCDANFKDCDNDGTPDYLDFFTCGVQLEIPEGFSPNGDNTNDTWVIPGVSEFPENTITVFNRWGAQVYAKTPYDNSWDGTCNENAIGGNLLPEGTYFYVFTTGPNGETKNGYVYIKR